MKIFITDNEGNLIPVDGKSVVIELNSGGTIEIAEEYSRDDVPEGINLWGGREPWCLPHCSQCPARIPVQTFIKRMIAYSRRSVFLKPN